MSEGGSLSLISVTRYDAGVYSCHADNGVPPAASKRVRLDVICTFISVIRFKFKKNITNIKSVVGVVKNKS